jgi:excisionase family DNA binding protein
MSEVKILEPRRPFFTPRSLAAYLSVSERTVRAWIADGTIDSYLIGGSRRIDPVDVDAYVAMCRCNEVA